MKQRTNIFPPSTTSHICGVTFYIYFVFLVGERCERLHTFYFFVFLFHFKSLRVCLCACVFDVFSLKRKWANLIYISRNIFLSFSFDGLVDQTNICVCAGVCQADSRPNKMGSRCQEI